MRSKEKYTINMRTNQLLRTLMKSPGDYFNVNNYHCTNAAQCDLFKRVTNMLKLMGIKYQIQKGTRKIRVLDQEQIAAYENMRSGTFSHRYGYSVAQYLRNEDPIKIDEVF